MVKYNTDIASAKKGQLAVCCLLTAAQPSSPAVQQSSRTADGADGTADELVRSSAPL